MPGSGGAGWKRSAVSAAAVALHATIAASAIRPIVERCRQVHGRMVGLLLRFSRASGRLRRPPARGPATPGRIPGLWPRALQGVCQPHSNRKSLIVGGSDLADWPLNFAYKMQNCRLSGRRVEAVKQRREHEGGTMNELDSRAPGARLAKPTVSAVDRPKPLHATVIERLRDMIVGGRARDWRAPPRRQSRGDAQRLAHADPRGDQAACDRGPGRSPAGARGAGQRSLDRRHHGIVRDDRRRRALCLRARRRADERARSRQTSAHARAHGAPPRRRRAPALFQAQP